MSALTPCTPDEQRLTAGMPPQVAAGFLRAYRKDHPGADVDHQPFDLADLIKNLTGKDGIQ